MAFPASPSDNQVHKEGNRSYVYDSTLGTWDHISEFDNLPPNAGGTLETDPKTILGNQFVRTSTHYPSTIVMTTNGGAALSKGTAGNQTENLWHQGGNAHDTAGAGNIPIFGWKINNGAYATESVLTWDYGVGNEKYISEISWYQQDGGGNSTAQWLEGSNDNFSTNNQIYNWGVMVNAGMNIFKSNTAGPYRYWRIRWTWSSANWGHLSQLRIVERDELAIHKPMMGLHHPVAGTMLQTTSVGPVSLRQHISSTASPYSPADALGTQGELRAVCMGKNSKFLIHFSGNQFHTNPDTGGANRGAAVFPHYYIGTHWSSPGWNCISNAHNSISGQAKIASPYTYRRSGSSDWDEFPGHHYFVHEPYNEIGDIIRYRLYFARVSQSSATTGYFHHHGGIGSSTGANIANHWHGTLQEIAQ